MTSDTPREEALEALDWFIRHAVHLVTDVGSAHSGRGNGASEWMREDDRDFRRDLAVALSRARKAHTALTASPAAPTDEETGKLVEELDKWANIAACEDPFLEGGEDAGKTLYGRAAAHLTTQAEQIARLREELERSTLFGTETHREYVDSEARAEAEIARLTARLGEVTGERDDLDRKLGDCECGYADIGDKYRAAEAKLSALTAPAHDLDALREAVARIVEWCVKRAIGRPPMPLEEIIQFGTKQLLALPAIRNALAGHRASEGSDADHIADVGKMIASPPPPAGDAK